jgi:hypothetical protein
MDAISANWYVQTSAADHAVRPIQVIQLKRQLLYCTSVLFTRGSNNKGKQEVHGKIAADLGHD